MPGRTMSDKDQIQTLSAEVKPVAKLLQYQDGSIVSRVLLKNKGGSVTLFAFDQGEGLSEHTAPFEALVLVVDGGGRGGDCRESLPCRTRRGDHASGKHSARGAGSGQIQDAADHDPGIEPGNV